jgi:biotin carboxyl carrier protein
MYQTKSASGDSVTIAFEGDQLIYNDQPFNWSLNQKSNSTFLILKDHKSFRAEILDIDVASKKATVKIEKSIFEIELKDKMDLLLEKMGIANLETVQVNDLKAPMPGLILDILVTPGQNVKKGDQLLILEAMKMENVLKAPGDGIVASIEVEKGKSVEKGQILINF